MKVIIILIVTLLASLAYGNQVEEWTRRLEMPSYEQLELKPTNFKGKYKDYDFSDLMSPKSHFLGYIGPNYRRLYIQFRSIKKVAGDVYEIQGNSMVRNNGCEFKGRVKVRQVREYKKMHFGIDDELINSGMTAQGLFFGEYEFREAPQCKDSGGFKGVMTLYWYKDKNGAIKIDDIESFSDNYMNNQYIGVWEKYDGSIKKTANWGEHRIPFSAKLDIGAGEFGVGPKYYSQGWEEFNQKNKGGY